MFAFSLGVSSTSAIPDYPTLKQVVADWLDRDDLATKIPMFVQMCEAMFNRELRTPDMESTTTLLSSTESVILPTDYLAMRSVYLHGSPDSPLRGISPTTQRSDWDGTAGIPVAYTLVSGVLRLVPPPESQTALVMDYWAQIEPLSDANESNWLLQKHPDAYLYGTLYNAEAYLDNSTRAAQWKGLLTETLAKINAMARSDRFGAGPLVPNTMVQVSGSRC
jgi:hypothetical protein